MKRFAFTLVDLIVVILILLMLFGLFGARVLFQTPFYLLFGWVWGLYRLFVGLANEPAAVGFDILAFLLLPIALHIFVAQIAKRRNKHRNKQWTFKKSFVVSSLIVLIAGASIATVGGIHEIIWLFGGKEPFLDPQGHLVSTRMISRNKLVQFAFSIHNYNDQNERLPSGGTILNNGKLGHGWMTKLLPYLEEQELYDKIDFSKTWNDSVNAAVFRERLSQFYSPYLRRLPEAEQKDQNGFARTDYVANQFLLPVGKSLRVAEITDGMSNTILAGEAVHNLRAWGSPLNSRDPKLGINKSPYGFGSKHVGGTYFVFGDGAVKFLNEKNTNQKILEALATPNGGEPEGVP
jgi:hypothetical protein